MKKLSVFLGICIVALTFVNCNQKTQAKNNTYLGELPSIDKSYNLKEEEKEKALEECTDMEKAFKLSKENELLKKEHKTKVKDYIKKLSYKNKEIPFETINNEIFTTNQVIIDTIYGNGRVLFKFKLTTNNNVKKQRFTPFVYFKALNANGEEISGTKTVAAGSRTSIQPNLELTAKGILEAYLLEDFAKIKLITSEEYNNKK